LLSPGPHDPLCRLTRHSAAREHRRECAGGCGRQYRAGHYAYALDIEEISVWGEVAVVRLVWTLTVNENGADTLSIEPGMDIFARQPDGTWKITRFMAYQQ
jgi:ketosteroid isomerase-like protein